MTYDLAIIGSGPGGYVAAIRAAQLGMKTAIIEKYPTLGGTCLNVGCIPSKALLDSSEHFYNAQTHFLEHGIGVSGLKLDLAQMVNRKAKVVSQTCDGVEYLMKKNKVDIVQGLASFKDKNTLNIEQEGQSQEISAKNIIIATGSKPNTPDMMSYDRNRVITSTEALNITKLPRKMIVIGAGVIGLELGSVFARLGTEVSIIEYQDRIIAGMDGDCSKELRRSLKKIGIKFYLGHAVQGVTGQKSQAKVQVQKKGSDEIFELVADYCLVAIGRVPYTKGLMLENAGVQTDDKGRVVVNEHLETTTPGIYAIGDVIPGAMLAHKAEEEGIFVTELMAGQKPHIDYNLIPGVVYTWPEVAAVGKTEEELKEAGVAYKSGKFPYKALGRSRASGDIEGMVKVLSDASSDEILGVHIVGARAADMIMEAVALMEFRATAEDMARISHPHPTYTEAVREAALAATAKRPLHI